MNECIKKWKIGVLRHVPLLSLTVCVYYFCRGSCDIASPQLCIDTREVNLPTRGHIGGEVLACPLLAEVFALLWGSCRAAGALQEKCFY